MKTFCSLFFTLTILVFSVLTEALYGNHPRPHHCCLSDNEAKALLHDWTHIFDGTKKNDLKALVYKTLAPGFIAYEETFNNGASPINLRGRQAIIDDQTPAANITNPLKNVKFHTVYTFHNCDNIAYRWQFTATTTGEPVTLGPGVTVPLNTTAVPPGSALQYKGIDLLKVDCPSRRIEASYTSADWLNFLLGLGWIFCPKM